MVKQSPPARHWCFTHNNPTEGIEANYITLFNYDYLIIGHEVGEKGTPHLQGYVVLQVKQRLSALLKIQSGGHWEVAKGTPLQNQAYCSKGNSYTSYGTLPLTGGEVQQDIWKSIHEKAKNNDITGFFDDHPQQSFLHPTKFTELRKHYQAKPLALPTIDALWYIGPSGSGKSSTARKQFPHLYLKDAKNKWWPDYDGEDTILIDDLSLKNEYYLEYLKNWADHYPFRAEIKCGHTPLIRPSRIIVTTQYHWDEMTLDAQLRCAIARRFKIVKFGDLEASSLDSTTAVLDFASQDYALQLLQAPLEDDFDFEGYV